MKIFGNHAIVTGGSRGIGAAIVKSLALEGAKVSFIYRASVEAANELSNKLNSIGAEVFPFRGDASKYETLQKFLDEAIDKFGAPKILVNNLGIYYKKRLIECTPADWEDMFKHNVYPVFYLTSKILRYMLNNNEGVIINISSVYGVRPRSIGVTVYAATKAALIGFTHALAAELEGTNIRVCAVAPGPIETDLLRRYYSDLSARAQRNPLRRIGKPEEIAETVLYIIKNDFVNNEVIVVSGGE